jgi:hypothetical protein
MGTAMMMFVGVIAGLALGLVLGRIWEIRKQIQRAGMANDRVRAGGNVVHRNTANADRVTPASSDMGKQQAEQRLKALSRDISYALQDTVETFSAARPQVNSSSFAKATQIKAPANPVNIDRRI